jgi:hypothetical protein
MLFQTWVCTWLVPPTINKATCYKSHSGIGQVILSHLLYHSVMKDPLTFKQRETLSNWCCCCFFLLLSVIWTSLTLSLSLFQFIPFLSIIFYYLKYKARSVESIQNSSCLITSRYSSGDRDWNMLFPWNNIIQTI